jgi:hypothetical protein
MAANMGLIAKNVSLATRYQIDSMCKISIRGFTRNQNKYRWQAIDQENEAIEKLKKKKFESYVLTNGDTLKQLLARVAISYTKTNQSGLKPNRTSRSII